MDLPRIFGHHINLKKGKKRILFVSSSFITNPENQVGLDYFSILANHLVAKFQNDYDVALKLPSGNKSDDANEQRELLAKGIQDIREYAAIILSPMQTDLLKDEVTKYLEHALCARSSGSNHPPLLTIDKDFTSHDDGWERWGGAPPSVVADGYFGGQLAAQALEIALRERSKPLRCYVVLGGEGSESRFNGFQSRASRLGISIGSNKDDPVLDFSQNEAEKFMDRTFGKEEEKSPYYDGYFCCNDEMAIGVRNHLVKSLGSDEKPPKVVGFDGTGAVAEKVKNEDQFLIGTIDVRLKTQVEKLAEMLGLLLRGERPLCSSWSAHPNPPKNLKVPPCFIGVKEIEDRVSPLQESGERS
uniref:ABC-type sugar transport system, substrate-binding protein, contains N-terminal xre family HTH domain n=1 Tax=Candidatus Kentrum sp. LPFa TaxID=2126335 RepID=A0A450VSY3_9GAMM|nr:MAG: ABC-type sugar transport system, substrate-binding protein, contains N-terminal xre family HTH domain [Candidatus Kentron sp. LPFa]